VLTILGPDRPGLVEAISQAIAAHGGNWLESRMARLAGKFAGILRVDVPSAEVQALSSKLRELELSGLKCLVEISTPEEEPGEQRVLELELVGQDRPGIVRDISQALARRSVNVDELVTDCSSAPMSGETLFRARATLRVPPSVALDELKSSLERIGSDLMVEITLAEGSRAGQP
jgi:glycine cleavage system regulatory protein